ncbi:MAG: uroporphyrinogen-III synthase [Ignavibacteriae bacterium]|nr:uroporphyrinogen-III synthase [Ignavibacteriota bacterium]
MPKLILTRSEADNYRTAPLFKEMGVEVISLPMIEIRELPFSPSLIPILSSPPLILLTSRQGTERWLLLREEETRVASLTLEGYICVGERSAQMIQQREIEAKVVAVAESAHQLIAHLESREDVDWTSSRPVIYPCSKFRRDETVDGLSELGFTVVELPLYEPVLPEGSVELLSEIRQRVDSQTIVLFFSPSAVENFFRLWPNAGQQVEVAAIGKTTGDALRDAGCEKIILPQHPTVEEMAEALRHYLSR